jgi:hypothetical protein
MKTYFVGLNLRSRFPNPKIGKFFRSSAHTGHYLWRRETTTDIAKLAELVNEAAEFLKRNGNPTLLLVVGVHEVTDVAPEPVRAPEPVAGTPKLPDQPAKKPAKLQRKPKEHPFA